MVESKSLATEQKDPVAYEHPPGFRLRRVKNWFLLGLTYASYYLCRYNLGIVAPELRETLGFTRAEYGAIDTSRNWAYAVGQFVNGLFTDKLGGKQAMTIGAIGTVILNLAFGLVAWTKIGWLLVALMLIRMADGYVQAFGAPGMVKINTAWFRRRERGLFAGIYGFMINLGQMGVGQLSPLLARGFAVPLLFFTITVPVLDWRYMFIVPPVIVVVIVALMNLGVKNHPEEAGFQIKHDEEAEDEDPNEKLQLSVVFRTITSNSIVWVVAGAYFCTGFVRAAIFAWYAVYLKEVWAIEKTGAGSNTFWLFAVILLPCMASAGSLGSGLISDRLFRGKRAPVAALLYLVQVVFIVLAMGMSEGMFAATPFIAIVLIMGVHTGCNATHSILGTAAAMDLGGRKMAGFAAGVIDSFQYFGAGLAGAGLGWFLDKYEIPVEATATAIAATQTATSQPTTAMNPTIWFASMLPWGVIGTILMTYLWLKYRGTDARGS